MSWNGSNLGGAEAPKVEAVKKAPSTGKGLIAGLVVVLAVLAVWFFVFNKSESPKDADESSRSKQIAEATPALTKEALLKSVEKRTGKRVVATLPQKKEEDLGYWTNKAGQVKRRTGKKFIIHAPPSRSLFTNPAEDALSAVVNVPFGQYVVDDDVPPNFMEDFKASLTNKIVITENDTPEEAQEKQRVIEAKENLRKIYVTGGDVVETIRENKRELIKMWQDQHELEVGLADLRNANASQEEIIEYAVAAKEYMKRRQHEVELCLMPDEYEIVEEFEKEIKSFREKEGAVNE